MSYTHLFFENVRVDQIEPDAYGANTHTSSWLSMRDFARVAALIMVGTLGTNATLDVEFRQAKDSNGAGAKDISPAKAITQLTEAGGDSDKLVGLELDAAELDIAGGYDYVQISAVLGTATSDFGIAIFRHAPHYKPVDRSNLDELVYL